MRSIVHRHILLPAFETLFKRRKTFRYWNKLERTQWLTRGELESLQFHALRRLVHHAYERCPHYQEQWTRLGLHPRQLESPGDLGRWPVIDRQTIREHRINLRANRPPMRLIAKSTGGSSGVPLQFDLDHDSHDRRAAAWHRGYGWAGAEPGTRQLYLWGVPLGDRPRWKRYKDALYNRLHRRTLLNCFEFSDERVTDFLARLNRCRPQAIVGYTGALYGFARALQERGLAPFSPKSIVVGAEKLHPFQRDLIERVFRAPVFETYGSREFMLIGAECDRHAGLHLTSEHLLFEILDDNGQSTPNGEEGNVVITDLYNYGMPFVRYATGDRALAGWGECPCGRGLPLLRKVVGRRIDVLRTPDGRRIPGEFFPHLIKDFVAVRRFQVVQEELNRIELRLVAPDLDQDSYLSMERMIRDAVGPTVRLQMLRVQDIPLTRAGKLQVVVSRLSDN